MSIWGHRVSARLIATVVAIVMLGVFAVALTRPVPREITLVARGMAFYVDGSDVPNPTLTLKSGERVRVVLRNEDRGIMHDFAVPSMHAALATIGWNDSADVTFEAPRAPGTYEYVCHPHMLMMHGNIVVQD